MSKTLDIFTELEKIDKKMKASNGYFSILGRVEILYNPDKDEENIEIMSSGLSYPAILSVEQGIRLVRSWVDWLNKYSK